MRRRIRGMLMSGKHCSLDSRMDLATVTSNRLHGKARVKEMEAMRENSQENNGVVDEQGTGQ